MSEGQELQQIANESFNERLSHRKGQSIYKGWQWSTAVGQAMQGNFSEGRRKDRLAAARQVVTVTFDKARAATADRVDAVCACVGPSGVSSGPVGGSALESFAQDVWSSLNALDAHERSMGMPESELISGIVDIGAIIALIMGLIQAVRNCKNPQPSPIPTPAPV